MLKKLIRFFLKNKPAPTSHGKESLQDDYGVLPEGKEPEPTPEHKVKLESREAHDEIIECAKHALVMEYRAIHKTTPNIDELSSFIQGKSPIEIACMIRKHNPMALQLGERQARFIERLQNIIHATTVTHK